MYGLTKRICDIVVAAVATVILFPVMLAVGVAVVVDSGMPLIFRQQRVGLRGSLFHIYKFRTMHNETANQNTNRKWVNGVPDDFVFKTAADSRVTRVGSFLRRYSLDELPQLFNVLEGTMSLVGPRPEIPEIAMHYNEAQAQRLVVKPGITGLAQISGRGELKHGEKIRLDLNYVATASFWGDIIILCRTIFDVLKRRGAW